MGSTGLKGYRRRVGEVPEWWGIPCNKRGGGEVDAGLEEEDATGGSAEVMSPQEFAVLLMPGGGLNTTGMFNPRYWQADQFLGKTIGGAVDRLPYSDVPLDNARRPEQPRAENQHLLPGVPRTRGSARSLPSIQSTI